MLGTKARAILLVLIGLIPSLAVLLLTGTASLTRGKLGFLAAQYVLLLPILVWLGIRSRRDISIETKQQRNRSWLVPVLIACTLVSGIISYVLQSGVYSADESTYLFQARTIASGELSVDASSFNPRRLYFEHHLFHDGRWFGKYPIGWPSVLALGTFFQAESLVAPLLGALLLWLVYLIGKECFEWGEVQASLLFLALSPFFVLNNVGFMSHTACAVLVAAATLFFFRGRVSHRAFWFVLMALCVAAALLVRPFTAVCIGTVLLVFTFFDLRHLGRQAIVLVLTSAVLVATAAAVTFWFNKFYTGSYTKSPYALYRSSSSLAEVSLQPRELLIGLIKMTPIRIADTMVVAFPFLFLLTLYGVWKGRRRRDVQVLASLSVILILGHIVQLEDSDWPLGERYYFEGFFAAALLAGYGWMHLVKDRQWAPSFSRNLSYAVIAACLPLWLYFIRLEFTIRTPNAKVGEAVEKLADTRRLIFLSESDKYVPRVDDPNRPEWLARGVLVAPDPGEFQRQNVAAELGYHSWVRVTYDSQSQQARVEDDGNRP